MGTGEALGGIIGLGIGLAVLDRVVDRPRPRRRRKRSRSLIPRINI